MTIRTKYLEEYGLEGKQWVIPTDILALERFVKYIEARDRDGLLELLKANRAVWTDQQVLKDVLFIADGPVNWVANVRLGVGAYKPTEEDGWMRKKNYLRATAVEAVVPLHWLSKGE